MSEMPGLRPIPDFRGLIEHLAGAGGYGLNSCPGHCPYRDEEHAHLRYPVLTWPDKGHAFIAFADGRTAPHDLTQPAVYVPVPVRNSIAAQRDKQVIGYDMVLPKWPDSPPWAPFRDRIPRASRCYRADAGFMVHVKPDCRCR